VRDRRDPVGLALGAALVLVLVVVVEFSGGYPFHVSPALRTLTQVLIGGLLAVWGVAAVFRPELRPRTVLAWPVALAMLAFAASVFASERPRLSLEPALIGVASALTLLMLTALLRVPTVRRLVAAAVLLLGAGIAAAYLVEVGFGWIRWWSLVGGFAAPPLRPGFASLSFGSPNLVATFLLLLAPLAAAIAAERFGRVVAAAILFVAIVALILSGSRGGYIGLALAVGVAVLLAAPALWDRARRVRSALGGRRSAGLAVGAVAVAAVGAAVLAPGVLARLTLSGSDLRGWYWRGATEIWERSPLTGAGPGTWAQLKLGEVLPHEVNFSVPHAHNLYFQAMAEVGLLGTVALGVFTVAFLGRCIRVYRGGDRWTRVQVAAVVAGLVGLVGQQIPDYFMNLPSVALVAGVLIAWVDGAGVEEGSPAAAAPAPAGFVAVVRRVGTPLAVALGAVLVVSVPTLLSVNRAMWSTWDANGLAADGDWEGALAGYEAALAEDPDFTLYQLERANALAHLGRLEAARDAYAPAVDVDLLPEHVLGLAAIELELGNGERATELAELALERGWRNPTATLNAGRILEASGNLGLALDAYVASIELRQELAQSRYWAKPDRTISQGQVIDSVTRAMNASGNVGGAATVAAYAGRMDEARVYVGLIRDEATRLLYSALIEGIGGDREVGIAWLKTTVETSPGDFTSTTALARLLRDAGDPSAEEYIDRALILRADEAPSLVVEFSVVPAIESERVLGAWTSYPFAVYSRLGPRDLWPPQMLVIGVTEAP